MSGSLCAISKMPKQCTQSHWLSKVLKVSQSELKKNSAVLSREGQKSVIVFPVQKENM